MSDLISREALCEYALNQKDKSVTPNDIMRFPSAQPEKRTEERTETHACDLISRKEAIDALVGVTMFKTKHEIMQRVNASVQDEQGWLGAVAECLDEIEDLPSAQPDLPIKEKCAFCPHCNNCDVNDDLSIQPCVDTINRQDAIDALDKRFDSIPMEQTTEILLLRKDLRELPSAQPEVLACGEGELIAQPEIIHCGVEPRCETCEAFNKTRLLIPQPQRKRGKWIPVTKIYKVTEGQFPNTHIEWVDATEPDEIDAVRCSECREIFDFQEARNWCTECGADMREPEDIPMEYFESGGR